MHEWAIARSMIYYLEKLAAEKGRRVSRVSIRVGALSGVSVEVLREALRMAEKSEKLRGARFHVGVEEMAFRCETCGRRWGSGEAREQIARELGEVEEGPAHFFPELCVAFVRCPGCGSSNISMEKCWDAWIAKVSFGRGEGWST